MLSLSGFKIARGESRIVILTRKLAIKLPRLHWCGGCYPSCFSRFLFGLYGNSAEADRWRRDRSERMARVIFGGALCVVMERCSPITTQDEEAIASDCASWRGIIAETELSAHNFGRTKDGRVVAVDYAFW